MLTKVQSQPIGLDQSLDLSLVLDQIAGVRSNSVKFGLRPKFSLRL